MIRQSIFLSVLYLTGAIFTLLLRKHIKNTWLVGFLGFPAGMLIWVIAVELLLIFSIPVKLGYIISLILGLYFLLIGVNRQKKEEPLYGSVRKKDLYIIAMCFLLFVMLSAVNSHFNYIYTTIDSFQLEAMGRMIARSGQVVYDHDYTFYLFMHKRLIFLPALHGVSYLFGIKLFNAVYPVTSIWFVILFMMLCGEGIKDINIVKWKRYLVVALAGSFLCSLPLYIMHSTYLLANIVNAVYFSIALIGIFLWKNENKGWLIVSALSLAATVLIRKEMALFNIIPLVLIAGVNKDRKQIILYFSIYMLVAYCWSFHGLIMQKENIFSGSGFGFFLYILGFLLSLGTILVFSYVKYFNKVKRWLPLISIMILMIIGLMLLIYRPEQTSQNVRILMSYLFTGMMKIKVSIGALFCIVLIMAVIQRMKDKGKYIFIISAYLLMWLIMYSSFMMPAYSGKYRWNYSAHRVLLHILPFMLYTYAVFISILGQRRGGADYCKRDSEKKD